MFILIQKLLIVHLLLKFSPVFTCSYQHDIYPKIPVTAALGKAVKIPCHYNKSCGDVVSLEWRKGSSLIYRWFLFEFTSEVDRTWLQNRTGLQINGLEGNDAGIYNCKITYAETPTDAVHCPGLQIVNLTLTTAANSTTIPHPNVSKYIPVSISLTTSAPDDSLGGILAAEHKTERAVAATEHPEEPEQVPKSGETDRQDSVAHNGLGNCTYGTSRVLVRTGSYMQPKSFITICRRGPGKPCYGSGWCAEHLACDHCNFCSGCVMPSFECYVDPARCL